MTWFQTVVSKILHKIFYKNVFKAFTWVSNIFKDIISHDPQQKQAYLFEQRRSTGGELTASWNTSPVISLFSLFLNNILPFAWTSLEPQSSYLHLMITGMYHQVWFIFETGSH
jgi:hypothetical protein